MSVNALQAYMHTRVTTGSVGDLLLLLLDGAIKHGMMGAEALSASRRDEANQHLQKAQQFVMELQMSLDRSVALSNQLAALYDFCYHELVQANISREPRRAENSIEILRGLRSAWAEALRGDGVDQKGKESSGFQTGGQVFA